MNGLDHDGFVETVITDSNLKDLVILAADAEINKPAADSKNYVLTYDGSGVEGILTFDNRNNLAVAVKNIAEQKTYTMNSNELVTENLGSMGGNVLNINSNSYDIIAEKTDTGENQYNGITVNNGQTLNINNVGTDGSKGFSGFVTQDVGGAIYSEGGNINISNSIFSDNQSLLNYSGGGAIYAQDTNLNIKDSTFIGNSTINKDIASGGALLINQYSTTNIGSTTISNSDFIGNSAMRGGAIYNSTAEVTIKDTTFTGNTAGEDGGAIYNINSTLNITAENSDSVFTGNTANGVSNAIYNNGSTTNLNAKGGKIIFNDGISGGGTINVNNDSEADGVVEFNNTVSYNNINLYNGTLRLGHYAGGTITGADGQTIEVAESRGNFGNSVNLNLNGGTLDVIDNEIRNYTLGTFNGNGGKLSFDLNIDTNTADTFTISGGQGTFSFDNINLIGDFTPVINRIQLFKGDAANISFDTYAIFTNHNIIEFSDAGNGWLDYATAYAHGLKAAVDYFAGDRKYQMTESETITQNLGEMKTPNSTLTVEGSGYDIIAEKTETGENQYYGITVNNGQTLNINNVGTDGSKGFSGFVSSGDGGAIHSEGGTINVSNSVFSDNLSTIDLGGGGAIFANNSQINIKDSAFIGNRTIDTGTITGGGALYINQNNTEINGSDFINNSAMRGGAIYNSQAEITLTDSIFTGNTATEGGGAIYNINSTLNITAENSDSIFTGNSANGDSNAIHNVSSTVNLNAKGGKIVFNDGISGSTSNSININNDSDAGGVVEFNSSVKNNNIYLYDGTLKLGSHTYTKKENALLAGQTVYGSLEGSPTVDLIDNAVRETNLGNISLETDLQLAIDADLQANTADKITGSVGTANNNNIIISDVNILTDTNQPSTTVIVADENLKDLVMLSDYAEITKLTDVKNNYMLAYDNTDGSLTFNQELTLASVIAQTASDRIYNMAMDEEVKYDLGIMGGDGSRLTVNAGGYDINGNGYSGVTVNQGQTLNINNTGSESSKGFNGFVSKISGGAVNNNGTLNITDSSFSDNKAAIGGAIYNNGTANINADNKNVIFANNSASQNGGAIYNELNATLNIDAKNNNKIVFNSENDIYNAGTIRLNSGTVELNSGISGAGSTEINGGTFVLGNNVSIEQHSFTINNGSEFSIGSTNKLTVNELLSNNGKLTNDGSLVIGGTTSVISGNEITGSGTTFITGTVENQTTISQAVDIETGAALTTNTSGLGGTINNDGSLILAGTLDKEISGTGTTSINESLALTNNADIKGTLDLNEGNLNLQDNGLNEYKAGNLKGNGTVYLEADMSNSSSDKFIITDGSENNANVTISSVNITKDYDLQGTAENTTLTVLGGNIENVTHKADSGDGSLVTLTNDYRYEFTAIENGQLNVDIDKSTYRLSDYIDGTAKADNYSLTRDENVFSKTEIGTTSGDDKEKTVYLNGHNLIGDTEHSGITVTDGYTLNLNNGTLKDFDTALNNEGTLNLSGVTFENNKTDVANNNILNLSGSNSITGGITGKNGITNITDGKTSISSEIENIVNISNCATLEGSADYLGNTIANDGSLNLTAGIISNEISGNGTTNIIGEVTNNSTISQTVDIEADAKLISNASGLGAAVTNDGTLELNGGSLENNVSGTGTTNITDKVTNNAVISQNLAISENGDLTNNNDITANITNKGNLTSSADNIKGSVENSGNYNVTGGVISNAITGNGNTNIQGSTTLANTITDGTINLNSGLLTFTQNASVADAGAFVVNGGALSLQNGVIQNTNLGNVTLNQDLDLRLDGNFAQHKLDTISANSFNSNGNSINISNILITEPTKDMTFSISPLGSGMSDDVRSALAGAIQYTGGDIVYSPIYKYSASYDPTMGMFNFAKSSGGGYSSFNPDVFAAPVAAQLGGYLVQLNSYDNAFRNMDMYMLMTKEQRQAMKMRNRYATTSNNIVFDPTITRYENKAGWFRPYATFESVPLNNGPDVSNVAYGSFFGAESELYDFGHGWDGMWGVYAGYNGSHQAYDGVSIYQNGGTFGAVGMAYKGNFFTGLTANVGASVGEASAMFGNEDFAMLMSGVASKTGYNFELAKGKLIIQPSLLMSYSFINTFDYHNATGVSIDSDPLHAIQLEPGIKFIGNLKNGWQPYLGVSVVWNIMDRTHFQANNVSLPNLSIDPFVKYGVGVRKFWGERFTGFFQTYITNGGRNGVGLQAGFRWTLGKAEPDKQKTAGKLPELPKTRMLLTGNK